MHEIHADIQWLAGTPTFQARADQSMISRLLITSPLQVGPRLPQDRERFPPNNVLLMLCGAGFLWLGWNGFNGGAPNSPDIDASIAVLNTNIAAATALLSWTALDIFCFRKPSVIGAVQGMFAGLVCITPGAGEVNFDHLLLWLFKISSALHKPTCRPQVSTMSHRPLKDNICVAGLVQGWGAVIYGLTAGTIPWFTMMKVHRQIRFMAQIDDTLGVFHTHAVAGLLGGVLTGELQRQRCLLPGPGVYIWRDDHESILVTSLLGTALV